ncbi:hypothetical protein [Parasphingorhabdus sp.]|jgi:hypothetical protein|uniref:hypothetical protein n=1 Tax=Parasphingorhabdus sp. TaxID=2709688 RepID=UPI0007F4C0E0|nr:hypothetical protein A8B75_09995 [Sphingomonadales bacterium EhC05]
MEKALTLFLKFLPLIFAFGFVIPVIAQGTKALEWTPPLGLTPLWFALIIGGAWGLFAQIKGRWL